MTAGAVTPTRSGPSADGLRRLMRDRPIVPLIGLLLLLVGLLQVILLQQDQGLLDAEWLGVTLRAAIPLAILAGCQTLCMLTGGIDLSVGMVASMAAFIVATQTPLVGPVPAILLALGAAGLAGLVNGVGIGVFKVHPLIMTLGTSLVVLGLMNVYQLMVVQSGTQIPDIIQWLGSETSFGFLPSSLILFIPITVLIIVGLRGSGFGRLLFAVGDNPVAARLSGVRVWQVNLALYIVSGLLAALAGFLIAGLVKTASLSLVESSVLPSVAAAVIGGTSIMGGRGGYAGTIVGALILTVLAALLTILQMPEGVRLILFGSIIVFVAAAYTRVTGES
jgi:ribose transport system permease protein